MSSTRSSFRCRFRQVCCGTDAAKYSVHIDGKNHEGWPLACMDMTVSFSMFQRARSWLGW